MRHLAVYGATYWMNRDVSNDDIWHQTWVCFSVANLSHYPSNYFFQKHLATNLVIFKNLFGSFQQLLMSDSNNKKHAFSI